MVLFDAFGFKDYDCVDFVLVFIFKKKSKKRRIDELQNLWKIFDDIKTNSLSLKGIKSHQRYFLNKFWLDLSVSKKNSWAISWLRGCFLYVFPPQSWKRIFFQKFSIEDFERQKQNNQIEKEKRVPKKIHFFSLSFWLGFDSRKKEKKIVEVIFFVISERKKIILSFFLRLNLLKIRLFKSNL